MTLDVVTVMIVVLVTVAVVRVEERTLNELVSPVDDSTDVQPTYWVSEDHLKLALQEVHATHAYHHHDLNIHCYNREIPAPPVHGLITTSCAVVSVSSNGLERSVNLRIWIRIWIPDRGQADGW